MKYIFLVVFVFCIFYYIKTIRINKTKENIFEAGKMYLVPHMGYADGLPISSLMATQKINDDGFEMLDIDVRFSKDGVPIVFHDEFLEKNTDGIGKVSSFDYEDIKNIKIQEGKFHLGETIHTLESHFSEIKGNKKLLITLEIKEIDHKVFEKDLNVIDELLHKYDLRKRVIVVNKDIFNICQINRKNLYSGFSFDKNSTNLELNNLNKSEKNINITIHLCRPDLMAVHKNTNIDWLKKISEKQITVFVWGIKTKNDFLYFKGKSFVNGVVIDKIDLLD
jgi:glycerophosphoryl diester phosphodiesterase